MTGYAISSNIVISSFTVGVFGVLCLIITIVFWLVHYSPKRCRRLRSVLYRQDETDGELKASYLKSETINVDGNKDKKEIIEKVTVVHENMIYKEKQGQRTNTTSTSYESKRYVIDPTATPKISIERDSKTYDYPVVGFSCSQTASVQSKITTVSESVPENYSSEMMKQNNKQCTKGKIKKICNSAMRRKANKPQRKDSMKSLLQHDTGVLKRKTRQRYQNVSLKNEETSHVQPLESDENGDYINMYSSNGKMYQVNEEQTLNAENKDEQQLTHNDNDTTTLTSSSSSQIVPEQRITTITDQHDSYMTINANKFILIQPSKKH